MGQFRHQSGIAEMISFFERLTRRIQFRNFPLTRTARKCSMHGIGFTGYNRKKSARRACWSTAALFPLLKAAFAESVLAREFILRHACFFTDGFDIDHSWNMHGITVARALRKG
jgi:hypothetical protein